MALPDVVVEEVERRREDKGHDSHQLHENVEGRTRGILERITDRVADDTGLVGARSLATEVALLNVLLGVIPGTTRVGGGDGHLHTGDQTTGEHARQGLGTHEETDDDGRQHHQHAGLDHLVQRGLGGDGDAALVVGLLGVGHDAGVLSELQTHLLDHGGRGLAHGLHRHGGEPVGQHGADHQTRERDGL